MAGGGATGAGATGAGGSGCSGVGWAGTGADCAGCAGTGAGVGCGGTLGAGAGGTGCGGGGAGTGCAAAVAEISKPPANATASGARPLVNLSMIVRRALPERGPRGKAKASVETRFRAAAAYVDARRADGLADEERFRDERDGVGQSGAVFARDVPVEQRAAVASGEDELGVARRGAHGESITASGFGQRASGEDRGDLRFARAVTLDVDGAERLGRDVRRPQHSERGDAPRTQPTFRQTRQCSTMRLLVSSQPCGVFFRYAVPRMPSTS